MKPPKKKLPSKRPENAETMHSAVIGAISRAMKANVAGSQLSSDEMEQAVHACLMMASVFLFGACDLTFSDDDMGKAIKEAGLAIAEVAYAIHKRTK